MADDKVNISPTTGLPVRKRRGARKALKKHDKLPVRILKPSNNLNSEDIELAKKKLMYMDDPIKFIEECVKLPDPGADELMKLYEPQKRVLKSFFKDHHLILLKSRQIGMSTLVQAIITYICTFHKNCIIGVLSKGREESSSFCRKTEAMIDKLPEWIRPKYETKSAQFFTLKNGCQLYTSAISPANPSAAFRSASVTLLVIDEAAFIKYIDVAWSGIIPTISKAHKTAELNDIPFGTMVISTPNKTVGIGAWYFKMLQGAMRNKNGFKFHKIHWKEIPDFRDDPNWYKEISSKMSGPDQVAQELDLQFVSIEGSMFKQDVQRKLQVIGIEPIRKIQLSNPAWGEIHQYNEARRGHYHLVGIDVATEGGDDHTAIEVIEYETMKQIYEWVGDIDTIATVKIIKKICQLVPHNKLIVDATGGYGMGIIDLLLSDNDMTFDFYGTRKQHRKGFVILPGLKITGVNRPLMLGALYSMVKADPELVKSERLANELISLVRIGDRFEADTGTHDDLALAYAMCLYVRQYGQEQLLNTEPIEVSDSELPTVKHNAIHQFLELNGIGVSPYGSAQHIQLPHDLSNLSPLDLEKITSSYRKSMDKYIQERLDTGSLQGNINILEILGGRGF